jgi:hypothetical protein
MNGGRNAITVEERRWGEERMVMGDEEGDEDGGKLREVGGAA